jgi:DNA-binding NarL/FixJ family response regulator
VLSVRTVERHVANIYDKVGAAGKAARATATAYAFRHDLA